jgi:predicted esterase
VSAPDEDYDVRRESFDLFVPASYRAELPHGLLVWISASETGLPPPEYADVLAQRRLLWASARNSGNQRKAPVRVNLSLDVAAAVQAEYRVDPGRVWVGGFSGGGRSASKAALLYPDVFAGGLFVVGAEYARDVGPNADGKRWKTSMPLPDHAKLLLARRHRFVLLTGDADPNREELQQIHREYIADGYPHAQLIVAPSMGHQMPSAEVFERAVVIVLDSPQ